MFHILDPQIELPKVFKCKHISIERFKFEKLSHKKLLDIEEQFIAIS